VAEATSDDFLSKVRQYKAKVWEASSKLQSHRQEKWGQRYAVWNAFCRDLFSWLGCEEACCIIICHSVLGLLLLACIPM